MAAAVLSGNRNFEGRISPHVRANYLASPPLVVAYALAGNMEVNLFDDPLGEDADGNPVYLKDIWPSTHEVQDTVNANVSSEMFRKSYASVFQGDERWNSIDSPEGEKFAWQDDSTYIQNPPYFRGMTLDLPPIPEIRGARCLAKLGDSITTDHISPAGAIPEAHPAGKHLMDKGVPPDKFNSYGSRRGNHEVMMRGTFGNIRIKNQMMGQKEGSYTLKYPAGSAMFIYEAAMKYQAETIPLVVLAGK